MFSDTAVYPSRFGILIGTGIVSYDIFVEFFLYYLFPFLSFDMNDIS